MRIALTFGLLLCALPTWAQKAAVVPFTGPGADPLRDQIVSGVCVEPVVCVPYNKVTTGGKPDWKKAKKEKVAFIVTGAVVAKGGKSTLELHLVTKGSGAPKLKKNFTFAGTELPNKMLAQAIAALNRSMGVAATAEEPAREPPPERPVPAEETRRAPPTEAPPPQRERQSAPAPTPAPEEPSEEAAEVKPTAKVKDPVAVIDLAVFLATRSLAYSNQMSTLPLRGYSVPFTFSPLLRIEFYPLALAMKGTAAGLGLEAGYQLMVGQKSHKTGSDVTYPTSATKLDVGLQWRIRPSASSAAALIPSVGYRRQTFSLGTGSDGTTLDGLPAITYSAIRPGLSVELPFANSGLSIFGGFAAMIVLSSADLISPAYFKTGSAFGVEVNAGVGYRLIGPLELRASFLFQRYFLSFKYEATDPYRADGAGDQYLGGNVGIRLTF